jgi:hypothetical protein
MLRSSPCAMSSLARPSAFTVLGKSNAMRAGEATEKLGGTPFSGSLVVTRTTVLPACWLTWKLSMLFVCAAHTPRPASHKSNAWMMVVAFLVFIVLPPPIAAS